MKTFLRHQGLSLVLVGLFMVFWAAQFFSGWKMNNKEAVEHGAAPLSAVEYLHSGHFWQATTENWESEFLQMGMYVFLTTFLYQKGSAESKDPDQPVDPEEENVRADSPAWARAGGWRRAVYAHSLSLVLLGLFLLSFGAHVMGGWAEAKEEQARHGKNQDTLGDFLTGPEFWFQSFQNWQSEFLAVLSIVVLSIWLRENQSPESKPVAAPHHQTGR